MSDSVAIDHDDAENGGQLFEGKKFWVAIRVPCRHDFLQKLRANGGTIVPIEKMADILIADHAKASAPANSFSWKWIEDSLKHGVLQDLKDYPAGPQVNVEKCIGVEDVVQTGFVGGASKQTRTKFTADDDRVLAEWIRSKMLVGAEVRGNKIYEELATKNTRHTAQSWRDRYIKFVSKIPPSSMPPASSIPAASMPPAYTSIPRTTISRSGRVAPTSSHVAAVPNGSLRLAHVHVPPMTHPRTARPPSYDSLSPSRRSGTPYAPLALKENIAPSNHQSTYKVVTPKQTTQKRKSITEVLDSLGKRKDTEFVDEDRELLENNYDDIMDISPTQHVAAWEAWAELYPRHTAGQWHTYFASVVKPAQSKLRKERKKAKLKVQAALEGRKRQRLVDDPGPARRQSLDHHVAIEDSGGQQQTETSALLRIPQDDYMSMTASARVSKLQLSKYPANSKSLSSLISANSSPPLRPVENIPHARRAITPIRASKDLSKSMLNKGPPSHSNTSHPTLTSNKLPQQPPEIMSPPSRTHPPLRSSYSPPLILDFPTETTFLEKLEAFHVQTSRTILTYNTSTPHATVYDRQVFLHDLFCIVNSSKFGGCSKVEVTRRWAPVATALGFNCFRLPDAPMEVRKLYIERLEAFEINYRRFFEMRRRVAAETRTDMVWPASAKRHGKRRQEQVVVKVSDDDDYLGESDKARESDIQEPKPVMRSRGIEHSPSVSSSDDSMAFSTPTKHTASSTNPYIRPLHTQPVSFTQRKRQRVSSEEPEIPESPA